MEYHDKQRVSTPILLQGFANSDKPESNPNKQLSDERKLQIQDLSPISSQARDSLNANSQIGSPLRREQESPSPQILSPSRQSPMMSSSSPLAHPTSPVVTNSSPLVTSTAALNFANPFGIAASRAGFLGSPGLPGLPPGINPFFPHAAGMMLSNPFQRFPGTTHHLGGHTGAADQFLH